MYKNTSCIGKEGAMIGSGHHLPISSISNGTLCISNECFFSLNMLLHTSHATTNLLYFNQLCVDSKPIVEFHPNVFNVKD